MKRNATPTPETIAELEQIIEQECEGDGATEGDIVNDDTFDLMAEMGREVEAWHDRD